MNCIRHLAAKDIAQNLCFLLLLVLDEILQQTGNLMGKLGFAHL